MDRPAYQAIGACTVMFAAGLAFAASISGVSGTIEQGQAITVSGGGFGGGPSGVVFDDFEGGTDGNSIMTGAGSATVGQWGFTAHSNYYTDDHAVSGNLAFEADMSIHYLNYVARSFPAGTSEVFASWWVRIPSGNMPGEGNQYGINWKHIWIQGSTPADDDLYFVYMKDIPETVAHIGGNCGVADGWMWGYGTWYKGDWIKGWLYVKGGVTDGHFDVAMLHEDGNRGSWSVDGQTWGGTPTPYQYQSIRFNAYGRQTSNSYPIHDDCYSAYGSNCRARVEIGNAATYSGCTDLAICAPTSWSSSSITAVCNVGGLSLSDDWYLFVIDGSGSASAGHHVAGLNALTVTNGSGDGDYEAGAVVGISADPPASGKLFATWIGDITHVADRYTADTTVTMPSADVSVTATYAWGYELTVNSGTGGGLYLFGTVVNIQADPAPSNCEFDQWTGDTSRIADVHAEATTFTVPAYHCEVTASYEPALPGDVDGSGFVGQGDLDIILDNWGDSSPADPRADPSGDNFVGQDDLDIVLDHWGQSGP